MSQPRMGELLGRLVGLNGHDVDEILNEQMATRKRFGEIALSWGLCQPEHIWHAWSHQLNIRQQHVSLAEVGVDAQAIAQLSPELAWTYRAVPIRFYEQRLIIAVAPPWHESAAAELPGLLNRQMCFVLADTTEIDQTLRDYYPPLQKTA